MKLISVDLARTVWLFPLTELNPTGKSLTKMLIELAERYSFKKFPKHTLDFDEEKALTFEAGEFKNRDGIEVVVRLRIYSDGCVADCWSSTRDSQDFLEDAMRWLRAEHGLSLPAETRVKVLFVSQLTVTTEMSLTALNPKLQAFADMLSAKLDGGNCGFNLGSIGLWSDRYNEPGAPGPFTIEHKLGTPLSKKYYSAQAPLTTDAHLEALDSFERILA